jgi:oligopeptide/dipeptide ABC transporter ATP-binding protein
MIIITHNLGVVARYAQKVIVMYAGKIIETGTSTEIYHNPKHPYTIGLLKSVPRLDEKIGTKLDPIEGLPPDLIDVPKGCSFAARCKYSIEKCLTDSPTLKPVLNGHDSACWRADEITEIAGPTAQPMEHQT